jgi:Fe-S-cluster containining protein
MSDKPPPVSPTATATVTLRNGDWSLRTQVTVPTGPTRLRELVPLVQVLANAVVDSAVQGLEETGKKISCKAGCGACCRQLVPISEVEARGIRDLVASMPEPRRSQVRQRFAAARQVLEKAGLLTRLENRENWTDEEFRRVGIDYFLLGVPCPFLEEESCSIHPDRPVTCREYLVTSPPERCARPSEGMVEGVRLPLKVWTALARFDAVPDGSRFLRWVPLVLAPEWADAHPDEPAPRPGTELLEELFRHLTGRETNRPAAPGETDTANA